MMSWFRRYQRPMFLSVIAVFLIGTFVGLGSYYFIGADHSEAVAVVDGHKIPYLQYRVRVNQYLDALRERETKVTEQMEREIRQGILRDMIVDELLASRAEKLGLRVSDLELRLTLEGTPAFQREGRFDQAVYFQTVRSALRMTPEQYERAQRRSLLSAKFKGVFFQGVKVLPAETRAEYARQGRPLKDFEAKKAEFAAALRQERALDAINFYLRQLSAQVDIRSYLEQRESGA